MFVGTQWLYATQLLVMRHEVAAIALAVIGAVSLWLLHALRERRRGFRRLLVSADGRMHLLSQSGRVHRVCLHPASMRLGSWLLVHLRGGQTRLTLLLGPDNLPAAQLAALRRRLLFPRRQVPGKDC